MSLYSRLANASELEEKIPIHQFMAAISEGGNGEVTRAEVIATFNIEPADEPALDFIYNKMTGQPTEVKRFEFRQVLHDVLLLAEQRRAYLTSVAFVARLNRFS